MVDKNSPSFVGRRRELDLLLDASDPGAGQLTTVVLVDGDAGIGKSRLVAEFVRRIRQAGAVVRIGRCLPVGDGGLPYAPITDAFRSYSPRGGGPPFPDFEAMSKAGSFEALLHLLEHLAESHPQILVLEDLHWADQPTRELLPFFAANLATDRVTVVGTCRLAGLPPEHSLLPVLSELSRDTRVRRLHLQPLSVDELAEKLESDLGHTPPRDLVERVYARSQGNPFFAEELVASWRQGEDELPDTLREILLASVNLLAPTTRQVLRAAAAAGRPCHHSLLSRVAGVGEAAFDDAVRQAVDQGLLAANVDAGTYEFRHTLVAEAVSSTLLPGEREQVHGRFADALEDAASLDANSFAAEIAYHRHVAGDARGALVASHAAATEAQRRHAIVDARVHVDRMLGLWDQVDAADDLLDTDLPAIMAWAADLAHLCGDPERAITLLEQTLTEVPADDDPVRRALLLERLGNYMSSAYGLMRAVEAWRMAVELVPEDPPSKARARVLSSYAQALWEVRPDEGVAVTRRAVEVARAAGEPHEEARALTLLGSSYAQAGRLDEGVDSLLRAQELTDRFGTPEDVARGYVFLSAVLIRGGQAERGAEVALRGIERAREVGVGRLYGPQLAGNAMSGFFWCGRWDEAPALMTEVVGSGVGVGWLRLLYARLLAHRGQVKEAREQLELATQLGASSDTRYHGVALDVALQERDLTAALDLVRRTDLRATDAHAATGNQYGALALRAVADLHAPSNQVGEDELIELADDLLCRTTATPNPGLASAHPWRLTAEAEHARLRGEDAAPAWKTARQAWQELGWPHLIAYSSHRLAEALLDQDDAGQTSELLLEAEAIGRRLQAVPLLEDVSALARRGGVKLASAQHGTRRSTASNPYGLTNREMEVLALLVDGSTNKQIGNRLFITAKTASVHVSNILAKLEVSSRTEAAALTVREQLLDPPKAP